MTKEKNQKNILSQNQMQEKVVKNRRALKDYQSICHRVSMQYLLSE